MLSDERLKEIEVSASGRDALPVLRECVGEIRRLRAENETLKTMESVFKDVAVHDGYKLVRNKQDEIRRLREELARFTEGMPSPDRLRYIASSMVCFSMQDCEAASWLRRLADAGGEK